ncbi:MAG: holo-ACP synthase [Chloroflexi bacterium]|nr:holo-ACP synthase [Chloroflexota bacterium]
MLQTGIDLVEVSRIQAVMTRYGDRFLLRVFTEDELAYCRGHAHALAARFAAKEAVSKALGVGIHDQEGVGWREIRVVPNERGKPEVQLSGRAARRAEEIGLRTFALSLSHTRDHAIAVVVAQ